MKTTTIIINLYGDPKNVERVCSRYSDDMETKQKATYEVSDGIATITALEPVFCTHVNLTLPFTLPVNDLGSGILNRVEINCDTMQPHLATCPTASWAQRRIMQPGPSIEQILMSDYIGLL